jgi:hypothetical protein
VNRPSAAWAGREAGLPCPLLRRHKRARDRVVREVSAESRGNNDPGITIQRGFRAAAAFGHITLKRHWPRMERSICAKTTLDHYLLFVRRGGRVAEGGGLLNRYTALKPYLGFESHPLRHPPRRQNSLRPSGRAQKPLRRRRFVAELLTGLSPKPPFPVSPRPELSKAPDCLWISQKVVRGGRRTEIGFGAVLVWTAGDGRGKGTGVEIWYALVRSKASTLLVRHKIGTVPELPPWAQKARQIPRSAPTPRAGTRPSRGCKNHAGSISSAGSLFPWGLASVISLRSKTALFLCTTYQGFGGFCLFCVIFPRGRQCELGS